MLRAPAWIGQPATINGLKILKTAVYALLKEVYEIFSMALTVGETKEPRKERDKLKFNPFRFGAANIASPSHSASPS